MSAGSSNPSALQKVESNHVDLCHPVADDKNPSRPPSPNRRASLYKEPLVEEASVPHLGDVEKSSKQRDIDQLSPEFRQWPDDIVTFDSKDDPQNPKNVRCFQCPA
jgi:hypothetical protein